MNPRRAPIESDYIHALEERCETAFQTVAVFRRNVLALRMTHKGKERFVKAGKPGQCDLYAIGDGGKHFEMEVKRGTKLSPNQERWREWCVNRGIPWALLDVVQGELPARTIERWVAELREFFGMGDKR